MAELHQTNLIPEQAVVLLKVTPEYKSMEYMMQNKKILKSYNLKKSEECDKFIEKLNQLKKLEQIKYILIRAKNETDIVINNIVSSVEKINKLLDISFVCCQSEKTNNIQNCNFDIEYRDDHIKLFATPPIKFLTFVIVKDFLRLGQQVNTSHISIMHDSNAKNDTTVVQSLIGRACGYNKLKHDVTIFTSVTAVKKYIDWFSNVKKNNIDRLNVPTSINVKNSIGTVYKDDVPIVFHQCETLEILPRDKKNINQITFKHLCTCITCTSYYNISNCCTIENVYVHNKFDNMLKDILKESYECYESETPYFKVIGTMTHDNIRIQVLLDDIKKQCIILKQISTQCTTKTTGKERHSINNKYSEIKENTNNIEKKPTKKKITTPNNIQIMSK
jgi:hypothetical protein